MYFSLVCLQHGLIFASITNPKCLKSKSQCIHYAHLTGAMGVYHVFDRCKNQHCYETWSNEIMFISLHWTNIAAHPVLKAGAIGEGEKLNS